MAVSQLLILTADLGQGGCELPVSLWTNEGIKAFFDAQNLN